MGMVSMESFAPRTVGKVERLLDLMEEMGRHPDLEGRLAMHGGTAINLFMLDTPQSRRGSHCPSREGRRGSPTGRKSSRAAMSKEAEMPEPRWSRVTVLRQEHRYAWAER